MINIVYHRRLNCVEMKGHAKSGKKGHDLVCAAASILAYTLASSVRGLKDADAVVYCDIKLDEGDAHISCKPREKRTSAVELVFVTLCEGFRILAEQYPKNVSYTIM
jgi:uncharacterized protein YsxB (DUF464 family)